MPAKDILRITQDMQALAIAKNNLKLAKKKKVRIKDLVSTTATNIVGIEFLREQGKFIGELD